MALQGFHTSEPGKSFRFNEMFCLQAESAQSFNNGNMKAAPQLGSNWFPSEPVRSQLEQQTHKDVQKSPELDGAFRPICCFLVGFSPDQPVSPQLLLLHAAPGSFLPCCGAPAGPRGQLHPVSRWERIFLQGKCKQVQLVPLQQEWLIYFHKCSRVIKASGNSERSGRETEQNQNQLKTRRTQDVLMMVFDKL